MVRAGREEATLCVSWGFIGASSPVATVESARRSPCVKPSPTLRPPGSYCRPASAVELVTSRHRMGLLPKLQMLKDVEAKTTRRGPQGARPARGLPPSTGAPAPHVLRGSPTHRGKRQRTRSYAADLGRPPVPLPLGVGPLPLTFSRASRRVLQAF